MTQTKIRAFSVIMESALTSLPIKLIVSIASSHAWDYVHIKIGSLYYNLNASAYTAEVTCEYACSRDNYAEAKSLSIPAMVEYMGNTFRVTGIGDAAFAYCKSLMSVAIPQGIMRVGAYAFYHCRNLRSVSIADGLTTIGDCAFAICRNLKTFICLVGTSPTVGMLTFGCVHTATVALYIPQGCEQTYSAVKPWKYFRICT